MTLKTDLRFSAQLLSTTITLSTLSFSPSRTTRNIMGVASPRKQEQSKDKLIIFDTTLRDGEQSPGVTLTVEEKIDIAKNLSRLGVDVCEAGFPVASEGDFNAVSRIAKEVGHLMTGREAIGKPMTICGLARATENDIRRAFAAVQPAPCHRIHTFLATSDIHLEHKLRITRDECVKRASEAVRLAASLCSDVEFSPEDAGRSDRKFLCEVLAAVIKAGATTLNIPDTVGYNTPDEYGSMIKHLVENTDGAEKVIWSTHCHNDLGLATANTLSGIMNGARQVEVTINGIGERAGNTALEEVIMAIYTHPTSFPVYHTVCTEKISRISALVSNLSGMLVQPNKAIVGCNAFLHESGIHQDGVLKNKQTYEIIRPETVGVYTDNLVLGKHSGRAAFRSRLQGLGYGDMNEVEFQRAFERFKALADVKKRIAENDLVALLSDQVFSEGNETFSLLGLQVTSGIQMMATATVHLEDHRCPKESAERDLMDAATGPAGPINAIFCAITRLTKLPIRLRSFEMRSVGEGMDALAQVVIRISKEDASAGSLVESSTPVDMEQASENEKGQMFQGHGTDNNILTAAAKAFIIAINRMITNQKEGTEKKVPANELENRTETV